MKGPMRSATFTHTADDGTDLFVYRWEPDDPAKVVAIAHILHGMAEHAARYARLAETLTAHGFRVYAHDHRGHGRTAKPEEIGHFGDENGWARVIGDARRLLRREMDENAGKPLVVLGHSMGSFMAQQLMYEVPDWISAVVLSASNGKPTPLASAGRLVARLERKRLGARGKSPVLRSLSFEAFNKTFKPNRTACDWLSRDEAEVDRYAADPLCGFECTTSTWIEMLDALAEINRPSNQAKIRKDLPVYIIAGGEDPVSEKTKGLYQLLRAYGKAGLTDVTHHFYPGARHEVFNETNRGEVTHELLVWLRSKVPGVS
jgi:alpha-beta hydrolase superfamily lysophospholipase